MLIEIILEAAGLFDRIEVFPLQVLHNRQLCHGAVVGIPNPGSNRPPPGYDGRSPSPLTADQLKAIPNFAHQDRLQLFVLAETFGEGFNLFGSKLTPRLVGIRIDLVD
jgi:hypothetical protein